MTGVDPRGACGAAGTARVAAYPQRAEPRRRWLSGDVAAVAGKRRDWARERGTVRSPGDERTRRKLS